MPKTFVHSMFPAGTALLKAGVAASILALAGLPAATAIDAATGAAYAASVDKEKSDGFYRKAKEFYDKKDINAAVIELKNALQQDPANVDARRLLGEIYLLAGNGPAAEKELKAAARRGKDDKLKVLIGRALLLQGRFNDALDEVYDDVTDESSRADTLLIRGQGYLGLGQFQDAELAFKEADKLNPEDVRAKVGLAQGYINQGKIKEAEAEVDIALQRKATSPEALVLKGELRRLDQDLNGAVAAFDKAIEGNENNVLARLGRAASLIDLNRDAEAQTDVQVVFDRSPNHPLANYLTALMAAKKKDYVGAQESLQQAGKFLDRHMPSVFLSGAVHYALNQLEQAVDKLEQYTATVPNNVRARKLLAAALVRKREPRRALEVLQPLVGKVNNDPQLLSLLGSANMQVGNFNEGNEFFRQASEIAPDVASIRTQLALSSLARGQSDSAVGELEQAITIDPDARQAGVLLALVKLRQGDFDGALEAAEKLRKTLKENPLPDNLMGAAYLGKGDVDKARRTFEGALEKYPDFHPARMNLAQLDIRAGNSDRAKKQYGRILEKTPKHVGAMMAMATLARQENDHQGVVTWLQRATEANPGSVAAPLRLISYYGQRRDFRKALTVARELNQTVPNNPSVLEALGRAETADGQPINAVATFKRLVTLSPKSVRALGLLAGAQVIADDPDAARKTLADAQKMDPDYVPAQVAMIELEAGAGNAAKAMELAVKLRTQKPDIALGDVLVGDLYVRSKNYDEAIAAYNVGLEKRNNATLAIRRFSARRAAGQEDVGLTEFKTWIDSNNDRRARHVLASAYLALGKNDDAIRESEYLLKQEPENPVLLNNLAWLYQQKQDKRSVEFAQRAYKLAPNSAAVADTLGWIYVELGEYDKAVDMLQKANGLAPQQGDIQYHYAVALEKAGRKQAAKRELEKLLDSGRKFSKMEEAKGLLKQLGG